MKEIHKVDYMPEKGDLVHAGDLDENGHVINAVPLGRIASIHQHCGNCEPYANIVDDQGKIVASTNLDYLEWDAPGLRWLMEKEEPK